jgi:hypothetical protein
MITKQKKKKKIMGSFITRNNRNYTIGFFTEYPVNLDRHLKNVHVSSIIPLKIELNDGEFKQNKIK